MIFILKQFKGTHWTKMPNAEEIRQRIKNTIALKGKDWLKNRSKKGVEARNETSWNKGLPPEKQPRFGQPLSALQQEKCLENLKKGREYNKINGPHNLGRNEHNKVISSVIRNAVREKAFFKCEKCGRTEQEEKQELAIHHDKRFNDWKFDHLLDNLHYLCHSCHIKTHWKQGDYWKNKMPYDEHGKRKDIPNSQ